MTLRSIWLGMLLTLAVLTGAHGHEARPAYMEINEVAPHRYQVTWRTPLLSGMRLPVVLRLPAEARNVMDPAVRELPDSVVERRLIDVPDGLAGRRIDFVGLQATITDVMVKAQLRDGSSWTELIRPSRPWIDIAVREGPLAIAGAYIVHGIEHILLGFDHLLFVLALVLIVRSGKVLLVTITAFTIAHSITLSLATLGIVQVPGPPVEAAIALSILLLACEIVRSRRGHESLTATWPWLVAFSFGLLHGFGFASVLTDIGLPQTDIPLALFSFNVGVEIGQLAFIVVVLASLAALRMFSPPPIIERYALSFATYGIGALAAFWFFDRLANFIA